MVHINKSSSPAIYGCPAPYRVHVYRVQYMGVDRKHAGYLEGSVSVVVNLVLFAAKMYAGMVSNSIALIADAFHTLSDCITSLSYWVIR